MEVIASHRSQSTPSSESGNRTFAGYMTIFRQAVKLVGYGGKNLHTRDQIFALKNELNGVEQEARNRRWQFVQRLRAVPAPSSSNVKPEGSPRRLVHCSSSQQQYIKKEVPDPEAEDRIPSHIGHQRVIKTKESDDKAGPPSLALTADLGFVKQPFT
ncbi:hypothetical protein JCM11641_001716 [Rhodosporidiobolus odoratus]